MNKRIVKSFLLVFAILCLGLAPAAFATTEPTGHGTEMAVQNAGDHESGEAVAGESHGAAAEEHGAVAEGHGGEHHGKSITPERLKNLFWRTVNFIALLIILMKFLAKPVGNSLAARQQRVREELEDLQARRDEAERAYKEFESRLAGMEKEMESVIERAVAQAQVEKTRILEEAGKAADDIQRQAEAAVQAAIVEAGKQLRLEVADQAAAMAEELIVKNLTPADQIKITEQYLDRVGAVQ